MKFIFVAGGVMSGIGKGIATASIGRILQSKGFKVTALKIDPYINVDAGTMNPIEHGEIFVTKDGVDYTTTAYIKFIDESTPRNYFSTTTDFATFHRGQLSMPSGYERSGDPLALNPFTCGIASGRMYVTGVVFNIHPDPYHYGLPNGIGVWRSDNGGISWSYPTISAVNNSDDQQLLDKPAIAVSWHYGTRGYVYVAYMKINRSQTDQLLVTRSTNGGVTFGAPVLVAEGEDIQGPQIFGG